MKTNKIGKKLWEQRFGEAYALRWKNEGHTQAEFAKRINEIKTAKYKGTKGTCKAQFVSKWLNGSVPSEENVEAICMVLDLPIDYFEPSHDDLYRDSKQFITGVGQQIARFSERYELDLGFVESLTRIVDFDTYFPVYSPICNVSDDPLEPKYGRESLADSAQIDKQLEFMQVKKDGKTITLSIYDMMFLKEAQDCIADYARYLFYQRWEEMNKAVEKANKQSGGRIAFNDKKLRELDEAVLRSAMRIDGLKNDKEV